MNPMVTPAADTAATRGEFLALHEPAVRELEREILSPSSVLRHTGQVAVSTIAVMLVGSVLAERDRPTVLVVMAAVLLAAGFAALVPTVRRAVRNRKLTSELMAWQTAERQARSLPPGQVRRDLRTPFDARHDADFDVVAIDADRAAYGRVNENRLMLRLVPPSLGLLPGFIFAMGPFADPRLPILWGVAGSYLLVCCVVAIAATMRFSWRAWMFWRAQSADITAWRAERIGPIAAAEVDRAWLRKRWQIAAPFIAIAVLGLVARVMASSPSAVAALAVVVVIGLLAGVVPLVRHLRRRAGRPAEHDLTSVPPG